MLAADSPSENFEGGLSAADNSGRLLNDAISIDQAQPALIRNVPGISNLSQGFPQASVTSESITFFPGDTSTGIREVGNSAIDTNPFGEALSSLIQTALQMPGPLGLLAQLFQFISSLIATTIKGLAQVFDPTLLAQQAQSAVDLKKMMLQS